LRLPWLALKFGNFKIVEFFHLPRSEAMPRKKQTTDKTDKAINSKTVNSKTVNKTANSDRPKVSNINRTADMPPHPGMGLAMGLTAGDRLPTNPDLFADGITTNMASALPIWEASNIFTQRGQLPWQSDSSGSLHYTKNINTGEGAVHFWVTNNLTDDNPATLAGAAALAVIDTFDIRAACMHLIFAAHATQMERPWEQELVLDDRQIEAYLGLKKRTDKNRQEKLALIEEIVRQPCQITTFISWPTQGKIKGFTLEEGRLWHLMGTRYHYQQDIEGNKELIGMTFIIKAGLWAKYFLNKEGQRDKTAYNQQGTLPKTLLESVMSVWQHHEGAARLMVWLLFKTQFNRRHPLDVQTAMTIAYGEEKIEQARKSSEFRKKFVNTWDEDLLTLHERGWSIHFDPETYPPELQPISFARTSPQRPRGFFEALLSARLWITPEAGLINEAAALEETTPIQALPSVSDYQPDFLLTGAQVRAMRVSKGWSQRKLAQFSGISQGLISLIENGERTITPDTEEVLRKTFHDNS
jgi:hypothetical protein